MIRRSNSGAFPDGAMIGLTFTKTTAAASIRDSAISSLTASGYQIAPAQQITVAGKPATL